jgi:hypothetical protein
MQQYVWRGVSRADLWVHGLDAQLVDFFVPGGKIRPNEGPMWDNKVGFCNPTAVVHVEALLACELLHDIACLYKAFGGYLIIAFTDVQS